MTDFDGKVAMVTGAARGIGAASAMAFASAGAAVAICDVLDQDGERTAADINAAGGMAVYVHTDVADAESVEAVGDLKMQAGMPAEVYIEGGFQTALQYLLEPITSTLRRAARQM